MISWKCYWTAGGAVLTGSAAALMAMTGFSVPLGIGLLVLAAVAFSAGAAKIVPVTGQFNNVDAIDPQGRDQILRLLWAAAAAHVVWSVVFLLRPQLWLVWMLVLIALAGLEYGLARGYEYKLAQEAANRENEAARQAEKARVASRELVAAGGGAIEPYVFEGTIVGAELDRITPDDPTEIARRAFQGSGHGHLSIQSWRAIGTRDDLVGVAFRVRIPKRQGNKQDSNRLGGADIEPIAIAMSEELHTELASDWVQIIKEAGAGVYTITVTTVDTLARIYPYRDPRQWRSIKDPVVVGYRVDSTTHAETLRQHWGDTGQTRSGKTSLIQTKWANITLCHDAVLWVCGTEKLFDAVGPWIEPYLDTDLPVPIDWIANGPQDSVNMLATAMTVARWRQSVPHSKRGGFKTIIVQIDEASFFLVMNKITAKYQRQNMTPSELAEAIVKGAGSADVWLHVASQRGTNNNWGDRGGDINANLTCQTVFKTGDIAEIGRCTGDYKLPNPRNRGEFLINPSEGPVERLKAGYIQETDPTKPTLHDGDTIADIAWARRHFHSTLDPETAQHAGEYYANRRTNANDIYEYLTGMAAEVVDDVRSAAYSEAFDAATAELDAMLATVGITPTPSGPAATSSTDGTASGEETGAPADEANAEPTDINDHRNNNERILAVLRAASGPLSPDEIVEALAGTERPPTKQVVTNGLTRLVREERIDRAERGLYCIAS